MTGPLETAYVEIRADTSRVKSDVDNGFRKPMDDSARQTTNVFRSAFGEVGKVAALTFRNASGEANAFGKASTTAVRGVQLGVSELDKQVRGNLSGVASLTKQFSVFGGVASGSTLAAGGLIGGVGAASVALTAVLLKNNATLTASYTNLGHTIQSELVSAAQPAVPAFQQAAGEILKSFNQILPQVRTIFAQSATFIAPLTEGITGLFVNIMPGITAVISQAGPVIDGIADLVSQLGAGVGAFLTNIAPAAHAAGDALSALGPVLASILGDLGSVLGALAQAGGPILEALLPIIQQVVTGLASTLIPIIQKLGPVFTQVVTAVQPLAGVLLQLISAAAGPIIDLFTQLGGLLTSTLIPALTQILSAVIPLVPAIVSLLSPLMPLVGVFAQLAGMLAQTLSPILAALLPIIGQISALISQIFADALQQAMTNMAPLLPMLGQIAGLVGQLLLQALNAVAPVIPIIMGAFQKLEAALLPLIPPLLQMAGTLITALAPILPTIATLIASLVTALIPLLPPLEQIISALLPIFIQLINTLMPIVQQLAGVLSDVLATVINAVVVPALKLVAAIIQNVVAPVMTWLLNNVVRPVFTAIGDTISFVWNNVIKPVFNALKTGLDAVGTFFSNTKATVERIWNALGDIAMKPIRFVINTVLDDGLIAGWNKVVDFLHLGSLHIPPIPRLATGGIIPGYTPGRDNRLIAVGGGEAVMRPEWTRAAGAGYVHAANAAARSGGVSGASAFIGKFGLPGFAGGGIVGWLGNTLDSVGNFASGVFNGIVNFGGQVLDFVSDPVGGMEKLLNGIIGGMGLDVGDVGRFADLALQAPKSMVGGMVQKIKDWWNSLMSSGGGAGGAGVSQWSGLVLQVLQMLGQSASLLPNVLRRMNQESGGNASAVNNWDVNARNGVPSQGLMQVIPPTFAAYAGPFRGLGILNPLANIYAGLNYAIHRYPSLQYAMDKPGGYDNGGPILPGLNAVWNGTGQIENVRSAAEADETNSLLRALLDQMERLSALIAQRQPIVLTLDSKVLTTWFQQLEMMEGL